MGLKGGHQPQFVLGARPGEDIRVDHHTGQLGVVHLLERGPGEDAVRVFQSDLARDRDGDLVFLARSAWDVGYQQEKNPELNFGATKER